MTDFKFLVKIGADLNIRARKTAADEKGVNIVKKILKKDTPRNMGEAEFEMDKRLFSKTSSEYFCPADFFWATILSKLETISALVKYLAITNNCRHVTTDVCRYYEDLHQKIEELRADSPEKLYKHSFLKLVNRYEKLCANLSRSYALQKKCHPTKTKFICYCDE